MRGLAKFARSKTSQVSDTPRYELPRSGGAFLGLSTPFQNCIIEQSTGVPEVKFFAGFVLSTYFLAALLFGVVHHRGHPEDSFFDAVAGGLAWPGLLVEFVRIAGF